MAPGMDNQLTEFGNPLIEAGTTCRIPIKQSQVDMVLSADSTRELAELMLVVVSNMDGLSHHTWKDRRQRPF